MRYPESVQALVQAGIALGDAVDLRRISMTLHRWHEMECGDSNDYCSYSLVRGNKVGSEFTYDDAGKPYLEMHRHSESKVRYEPIADREKGALKRLAAIMARYPRYEAYIQTDPRGASLYILHPNAIAGADAFSKDEAKRAEWLSANYTRGIAVFK